MANTTKNTEATIEMTARCENQAGVKRGVGRVEPTTT